MHPKDLSISDFTYELPDDRIAKHPLPERDKSKLLVFKSGKTVEDVYANIADHLPEDALLVFNNTKVVEARLMFQKSTGAQIEVFCLEPDDRYPDITTVMLQQGKVYYKCLIGGASKWKHGMKLEKRIQSAEGEIVLVAAIAERLSDCFVIELEWQPVELSFAEMLHLAGMIPLPPYLHRDVEEKDKERYQTIYAKNDGSVAAPTAGLHFTNKVFERLRNKNIQPAYVTLHVGAGTFKPVKAATMDEHEMHAEFIDVNQETLRQLIAKAEAIIVAVGTTSLRTIESLYWMGVKLLQQPSLSIEDIVIHQWDPYEIKDDVAPKAALQALLDWMVSNDMQRLVTKTQILIAPGYDLRVAKGIITNFHQPNSTLLLLVAAIIGDEWKNIYQHALDNDFRFLSYGDGCLLWK
ncbi:S-adenosylmethionine:tRNA ribosyltransferase-isomerase [Aridibaculum aurantiacum]|uniref:S-adenosylmethionine:tRNA ribosyltransferase-isomerase n=1 Tax=Aridibaculum aurantiacum TaxID=2810307 RepID=UPI001A9625BB|nr:S-adenosylmethionine:tRNA ribosyltransferase-isomerase [Aridibaculum aurantiacum]